MYIRSALGFDDRSQQFWRGAVMSDAWLVLSLLVVVVPSLGLTRPTIVGDLNKLITPGSDTPVHPVEPLHKITSVDSLRDRFRSRFYE